MRNYGPCLLSRKPMSVEITVILQNYRDNYIIGPKHALRASALSIHQLSSRDCRTLLKCAIVQVIVAQLINFHVSLPQGRGLQMAMNGEATPDKNSVPDFASRTTIVVVGRILASRSSISLTMLYAPIPCPCDSESSRF